MLTLTFAPVDEAPSLPDETAPGVQVWREHDGTVAAYGGTLDAHRHWMKLPGLASYLFEAGRCMIVAHPHESGNEGLVQDAFTRSVLPMALQALGREVLHASGVLGPRGVVGLCAVSETGKSTLAYGLSRRGHPVWADDAVALDIESEPVAALPLPFALRLRPSSATFFDVERLPADARSVSERSELRGSAPLATLCVLERVERVGTEHGIEIERLEAADAFTALLTHAYCFTLDDTERKRHMLEAYLDLVKRVPVLRVRLEAGLEQLPAMLDELERATLSSEVEAA